jgi:hypoxanthine phosphoribosyltransferase
MSDRILPHRSTGKTMQKKFIAADDLLRDSFQLAAQIHGAGFEPDFLVGLWRGGSAVGIAVQEGLDFLGVKTDHIAIRTSYRGASSYSEMVNKAESIRVHGLQYLLENLASHHSLLIVDDVYSTGSSVNAVIEQLARKTRRNLPKDIRIATVWYRPTDKTLRTPDYVVHETRDWLALPYELTDMTLDELREFRPELIDVIDRLPPLLKSG